jgi:3-oxoacyl-[acyl-carrier-protein] synthase II
MNNPRPAKRLHRTEQNRVVVTGIGGLTPLGLNIEDSWQNALKGISGIANITRFNTEQFDVKIAGEVKGFNPDLYIHKKEQKKMDLFIHYALASAQMALQNANLEMNEEIGEKTGVIVGVGIGGLPSIEETSFKLLEKGPSRISPFFIPMVISNLAAGQISITHHAHGPNYSVTSACASGAHSIGEAVQYIRNGICDVMIAGGTESTVCQTAIGGFAAMKALSTRNDDPTQASRPFDKGRDGFVLAEGSGMLILESLEHAEKRGANILCEITGYGVSSDAYHMTNPAPNGAGAARAITMALKDAGLSPEAIQYINAHGTSTPVGDELESAAIKSIFKDHAKKLWVSSTKSAMGHSLGAAGAIEGAFCVQALRDQIVPPTINLVNPSEACDLDYVPGQARTGQLTHVLNNSFGFGGTNACLIFSKLV